jgi:hypothetical protein
VCNEIEESPESTAVLTRLINSVSIAIHLGEINQDNDGSINTQHTPWGFRFLAQKDVVINGKKVTIRGFQRPDGFIQLSSADNVDVILEELVYRFEYHFYKLKDLFSFLREDEYPADLATTFLEEFYTNLINPLREHLEKSKRHGQQKQKAPKKLQSAAPKKALEPVLWSQKDVKGLFKAKEAATEDVSATEDALAPVVTETTTTTTTTSSPVKKEKKGKKKAKQQKQPELYFALVGDELVSVTLEEGADFGPLQQAIVFSDGKISVVFYDPQLELSKEWSIVKFEAKDKPVLQDLLVLSSVELSANFTKHNKLVSGGKIVSFYRLK